MKPYVINIALLTGLALGGLLVIHGLNGADFQPILSGQGFVVFPENAVPATINASSGQLNLNAGGSNQNIILTPSGTGIAGINARTVTYNSSTSSGTVADFYSAASGGPNIGAWNTNLPSSGQRLGLYALGYQAVGVAGVSGVRMEGFATQNWVLGTAQGSALAFFTTTNSSTTLAERGRFDSTGDLLIGATTDDASGSLLQVHGSIHTDGSAPSSASGTVTGTNNAWHIAVSAGTITSITVSWTGTFTPTACSLTSSPLAGNPPMNINALSGSSVSFSAGSAVNMASSVIYGLCF